MFESSNLPLTPWFMAKQPLSRGKNNVAAMELRRQFDVSYPTAWLMKHKIIEAMRIAKLHRALHGWASHFQVGTVSQAHRALDYYTARDCAGGCASSTKPGDGAAGHSGTETARWSSYSGCLRWFRSRVYLPLGASSAAARDRLLSAIQFGASSECEEWVGDGPSAEVGGRRLYGSLPTLSLGCGRQGAG